MDSMSRWIVGGPEVADGKPFMQTNERNPRGQPPTSPLFSLSPRVGPTSQEVAPSTSPDFVLLINECMRAVEGNARLILEGRQLSQDLISGLAKHQTDSHEALHDKVSGQHAEMLAAQKEQMSGLATEFKGVLEHELESFREKLLADHQQLIAKQDVAHGAAQNNRRHEVSVVKQSSEAIVAGPSILSSTPQNLGLTPSSKDVAGCGNAIGMNDGGRPEVLGKTSEAAAPRRTSAYERQLQGNVGHTTSMASTWGGKKVLSMEHKQKVFFQRLAAMSDTEAQASGETTLIAINQRVIQMTGINVGEKLNRMRDKVFKSSLTAGPSMPVGKSRLERFVDGVFFNVSCMIVIVLNAVWLGYSTSAIMKQMTGKGEPVNAEDFDFMNMCFAIWFTLEVLFRIAVLRSKFFTRHDAHWNIYDLSVVVATLAEPAVDIMNLSFMRTLRVLRIARVLRIICLLRFFTGLRLMIVAVLKCSMTFMWASCFIAFLVFMVGIIVIQLATVSVKPEETAKLDVLKLHYGSLSDTMYTMLLAVSNGQDWEILAKELAVIDPAMEVCFAIYVILMNFGVLNVVIGVFVHMVSQVTTHDRDLAVQEAMVRSKCFVAELTALMDKSGLTTENKLNFEAFQASLNRSDVQMYLATHMIDVTEAEELFLWLDPDRDGFVSINEFVYGCEELKGGAKAMQIVQMSEEIYALQHMMNEIKDRTASSNRVVIRCTEELLANVQHIAEMFEKSEQPRSAYEA